MTKLLIAGNQVVLSQPVRWMKNPHLIIKRYTPSETVAQAKQRLKLAENAHRLRGQVSGFVMYKGRPIPAVAGKIAPSLQGNTSGYATRQAWYEAHRPSNEAVEASIARLRRIAGQ